MLYMFGALTIDTYPFGADSVDRDAAADIVVKPVIGGFQPREFMGEGADDITISGRLLPLKLGGLDQLALAHQMRRAGARAPLIRGDGTRLGWYAIARISERHSELYRNGVGAIVDYSITFTPTEADSGAGSSVISALLSLFGGS